MASLLTRLGAVTVSIMTAVSAGAACSFPSESGGASASPTPTTATPSAAVSTVTHAACVVPLPEAWQRAITASDVDTAGISAVPRAVGPAGEVIAVRDNGDTRDLILIGADESVTEIYAVPEPDRNDVGFVAIDEKWIVVGVDRIPRNSNGVLPGLVRVDVLDRSGGPARTVTTQSDEDYRSGGPTIDSVALFDGKVYWITHESFSNTQGTMNSFDPATGTIAEIGSGRMGLVQSAPAGLTTMADGRRGYPSATVWQRTDIRLNAKLPEQVADAVGGGPDRLSLATGGGAYAWISDVERGGNGVAWWSPSTGIRRVTGDLVKFSDVLPTLFVAGPYVFIDRGSPGGDTEATVIDTRSGAVAYLPEMVTDADGGTIVLRLSKNKMDSRVGVMWADRLDPLAC